MTELAPWDEEVLNNALRGEYGDRYYEEAVALCEAEGIPIEWPELNHPFDQHAIKETYDESRRPDQFAREGERLEAHLGRKLTKDECKELVEKVAPLPEVPDLVEQFGARIKSGVPLSMKTEGETPNRFERNDWAAEQIQQAQNDAAESEEAEDDQLGPTPEFESRDERNQWAADTIEPDAGEAEE